MFGSKLVSVTQACQHEMFRLDFQGEGGTGNGVVELFAYFRLFDTSYAATLRPCSSINSAHIFAKLSNVQING